VKSQLGSHLSIQPEGRRTAVAIGRPPGRGPVGLSKAGLRNYFSYQPGSRYWEFQSLETGIYVLMAAILIAGAFSTIHHRDA
jgi:hypothetical protein